LAPRGFEGGRGQEKKVRGGSQLKGGGDLRTIEGGRSTEKRRRKKMVSKGRGGVTGERPGGHGGEFRRGECTEG